MAEIPNVVATEPIESAWGNAIRDRTVQRYATASERTSANPTPNAGELSYRADAGELEYFHAAAWRAILPVGVVLPYSGASAPPGFLLCNGAAVSRSTYAALNGLYSGMSYPFGNGNGTSTFNVPDLRQRYPMGVAASGTGSTIGAEFGDINHNHSSGSLTTGSAGAHTHSNPNTSEAGSHNHLLGPAPGILTGGSHSHGSGSLGTGSAGSHSHTTGGPSASTFIPQGGGTIQSAASPTHTHSTNSTGAHSHSVTGSTASATHSHDLPELTTNNRGAHTHTQGNTGSSGNHSHSVSGATGTNNPPTLTLHFIVKT